MELALCAMAFEKGLLPPNLNLFEKDPACDLDIIANEARQAKVAKILSNSFGFGGINACVVLGRV